MTTPQRWRLAARLWLRDWRAGEQRILVIALVIAVAASTAIGFFTDRLARGMVNQSADFLGADLALVSPRPVDNAWLQQARKQGLSVSETLEFASVVLHGDALQLSSIKAVDNGYPLRGSLRTASAPFSPDTPTTDIPTTGEAWAAAKLFNRLGLVVGDSIEIGDYRLRLTRVVTFEPGQAGDLFGMQPRLLMNLADVPATRVVQPGSRLSYQYLFAGSEAEVKRYRAWLKNRLDPSHELLGVHEGRRAVGTALERAERFLGMAVMAALVLAGVAIAMAARHYSERHFDTSAMLRCLGASQGDLLGLYLPQLAISGLVASGIGCLSGWLAQYGLFYLLADLLPLAPSAGSWWPVFAGFATGLVILAGFALPPVMRLRNVPPLRVLRRDLLPLPNRAWLVYGSAIAAVLLLIWRYTGELSLSLALLAGGIGMVLLMALLSLLLLVVGQRLNRHVGVGWRFGLNNLWRRRRSSINQILAFGLTLMAMALIALVRTDLITTWQSQLPKDVANHFAINIVPDQVAAVRGFFDKHDIKSSQLYPMVRGRLTRINTTAVREAVTKEARNDNALNRELNLTWSETLASDNVIVDGRWWQPGDAGKSLVSVESRLAKRLGIQLGDELGFSIGGRQLTVTVSSIRSVQWDSFRPNFYMVFPPGVLEELPATFMTSFHLDKSDKGLLIELIQQFPALTVLELDLLIEQVGRIFAQVTLAVEYVLLFVLLAGFTVLFAALQTSLDVRLHEGALLRALGASAQQLRIGHLSEFSTLGLLAGLLAAFGTESMAWLIYSRVLGLDYSFHPYLPILLAAAGALMISGASYLALRPIFSQSPSVTLRKL